MENEWVLCWRWLNREGRHKQDAVNVGENSMESVHNVGVHRDGGFTLIFGVGCLTPYFSVKKYGGGMMLVCY